MPPLATPRFTLINALSILGDPAVIAETKRRYAADRTDPIAVPGALRKVILASVTRNADAQPWDALHVQAPGLRLRPRPCPRPQGRGEQQGRRGLVDQVHPGLAKTSADLAMIGKVTAYAAVNLPAGSRGEAEKSVASITDRIKARKAAVPAITAWVAQHGG